MAEGMTASDIALMAKDNGCCGESITIQNVGTVPVTVSPNSMIFVKRIA